MMIAPAILGRNLRRAIFGSRRCRTLEPNPRRGAAWSKTSTGPSSEDHVAFRIDVIADDPGHFGKIVNIDVVIDDDQCLREHHLP